MVLGATDFVVVGECGIEKRTSLAAEEARSLPKAFRGAESNEKWQKGASEWGCWSG